jgi:hypothetical protein
MVLSSSFLLKQVILEALWAVIIGFVHTQYYNFAVEHRWSKHHLSARSEVLVATFIRTQVSLNMMLCQVHGSQRFEGSNTG